MTKDFILCSSVFLILAFIRPGYADEHFPFLAEVSKESVNVRAGPNTNFEKVDKLNKGSRVVVWGRLYEWYKIQPLSTTKAFIRSDYLKIKEGETVGNVIGNNVNIRCSANSNAASLGEVKKGTTVKVLEQVNGWCRLDPVAGTAAWIHQDFLKEVSADVPASMLIPTVKESSEIPKQILKQPTKIVTELITLQGTMQPIVLAPDTDVHYEIVIDGKNTFYLKDIPQIQFFTNTAVTVEGTIIPDPDKKFTYPLLRIQKIALVL